MKKTIYVRKIPIGAGHPIIIQSMTNTQTSDITGTIRQIEQLTAVGCDMVRVSVPNLESALAIQEIKKCTTIPIIADIHYDYKMALLSIENGADKIRINPSNIPLKHLKDIVNLAKEKDIPIRVGVNKGSVRNSATFKELASLTIDTAKQIEDFGYNNLILGCKCSNVVDTVNVNRELYQLTDYPLHVGLTEAGIKGYGSTKSCIAIGSLLLDGIGDTIRVSLSDNPIEEIYLAKEIVQAVGRSHFFVEIISCPTCARTEFDVINMSKEISNITKDISKNIKIAIMGCIVNGIGEGKDADFGVAGGKEKSIIFRKGEKLKTVDNKEIKKELLELLEAYNG